MPASPSIVTSAFAAPAAANLVVPTSSALNPAPATPAESLAIKLVERVAEISDQVASRPTEQIKIELDLPDTRIEIRLALRDGRLHADFRTDSADLRDALSHAWRDFASTQESSSARWAEPSFSTSTAPQPATPAQPSSNQSGQSSLADQREPRRDAPTPSQNPAAPARHRTQSSSTPAPSGTRLDSSRLLSALA